MKLAKLKFDQAQYLCCYCGSCARHFAIVNHYEQYISMTRRVARISKYAIHDFEERQKHFVDRALSDTKEGIIGHINDNGSVMKSMCPLCMLADYKAIAETMEEKKTDVLALSKKVIFEKNSLSDIVQIIEDVYLKQLFQGYVNVKDLRKRELV